MGVWEYGSGKATIPAFLDDYAYLIEAYIQLQEVTGDRFLSCSVQKSCQTGL